MSRAAHVPGFEADLEATPDDWGLRLGYADWLDDRGESARAAGHRVLARARRRPVRCELECGGGLALYVFGRAGDPDPEFAACSLPPAVHAALAARLEPAPDGSMRPFQALAVGDRGPIRLDAGGWLYFRTPDQAVACLGEALADVWPGAGLRPKPAR
jgi:uncharacterized protein (TIGR02996 family)